MTKFLASGFAQLIEGKDTSRRNRILDKFTAVLDNPVRESVGADGLYRRFSKVTEPELLCSRISNLLKFMLTFELKRKMEV